jgi:hypothetical protein
MWAQSRSYYSLAYPVPDPEQPGVHRIKVKVERKGVRVHHREAYIVKARAAKIGDLMAGALLLRTGENPHRFEVELAAQEPAAGGTYSVLPGLEIPIDKIALVAEEDVHRAQLEVYVRSLDQHGRLSQLQFAPLVFTVRADHLAEERGRPFVATFPLVLEPGSYAVVVGLVERGANAFSVAHTTFDIGSAPRP